MRAWFGLGDGIFMSIKCGCALSLWLCLRTPLWSYSLLIHLCMIQTCVLACLLRANVMLIAQVDCSCRDMCTLRLLHVGRLWLGVHRRRRGAKWASEAFTGWLQYHVLTIHVHRPSACTRTDRMPAQSEHMQYCHNGGMVPVDISLLTSCTGTVHARSARTIFCRGQLMVHSAHVFTQASVQSKHTLQCLCRTRGDAPWNRMRLCMLPLALVILCKNKVEVWSWPVELSLRGIVRHTGLMSTVFAHTLCCWLWTSVLRVVWYAFHM